MVFTNQPLSSVSGPSFYFLLVLSLLDQTQINLFWFFSALQGIPTKSLAQISNSSLHYMEDCKEAVTERRPVPSITHLFSVKH